MISDELISRQQDHIKFARSIRRRHSTSQVHIQSSEMSTDLSRAPLVALSAEARHLIGTLLNPPKVVPTETGLLRDWRGLAQVCSLGGEILPALAADPNPCGRIFNIVEKRSKDFTLQSLKDALEKICRWDILDDSKPLLEADTQSYLERLEKSENMALENNFDADAEVLTLDDQFRIERGEETQRYDAFLLYAEEDTDFALQMVEHLEKENNLKLCLKDRDLIAGITFEHTAIMKLISERCNRLITVISPEFLKSTANKFFINFAQATGIGKSQERKIIPCIYKNCELPPQLTYFSKIYYKKIAPEFFWDKLVCSIKAVPNLPKSQKSAQTSKTTQEITSDEKKNGFVLNKSVRDKKVVDTDDVTLRENQVNKSEKTGEIPKSSNPIKNLAKLPWKRKKKNKVTEVSSPSEETTTESIPSLPTLDGLDSLSSFTSTTNTTEKSKKKKKFIGSMQALLARSQ